jgi:hypothetical protein
VTKTYNNVPFSGGNGVSYLGFVNGETASVLGGALSYTGASQGAVNVGVYDIFPGGLTAANYNVVYASGTLTITSANSSAVLASSANPSLPGSNVTFTVTIGAPSPGGGIATGTVRFVANGSLLGSPVTLSSGTAHVTTALAHGSYEVQVEYLGDTNFKGTTNSLTPNQVVNTAPVGGTNNVLAYENLEAEISQNELADGSTDADLDSLIVTAVTAASTQGGTVRLTASTVVYTPPTNYTGSDSFGYTVTDSFGATGSGIVLINVRSAAMTLNGSMQLPSGAFQVSGSGVPNRTYILQVSTDLLNWEDLQIKTADSEGQIDFTDEDAQNYPMRFYRTAAL